MKNRFNNWLERRDPELHQKILEEGRMLNALGNSGALWTNLLALAHAHGIDPTELTKYLQKHHDNPPIVAPFDPHNPHNGPNDGHGGHTPIGGSGDGDGHGNHGNHDDHGDHSDHLHAHFYGDKEKEDNEEGIHHWMKNLGDKKGPPKPVNLPIFKQDSSGNAVPDDDDGGLDFTSIPNVIRTPYGYKPGINPQSTGKLQYQSLMRGEKPNVQSGISGEQEPINPQIAKFAARMKKAQQMGHR